MVLSQIISALPAHQHPTKDQARIDEESTPELSPSSSTSSSLSREELLTAQSSTHLDLLASVSTAPQEPPVAPATPTFTDHLWEAGPTPPKFFSRNPYITQWAAGD
ncbi:hypothetical protein FRB95_002060 [Tulasnella sp. JGI-2019a]|nr:hypothetical protein FRB95_002060 [Tulasnella sp. JGI-2019a]